MAVRTTSKDASDSFRLFDKTSASDRAYVLYKANALDEAKALDDVITSYSIHYTKLYECKELTEAIQNHEIIPYYQAKTDYTNGKVVGVEALARWRSDKRGLVSPGLFIPLIVEMNLTDDFTYYMIYAALKQYKRDYKKQRKNNIKK